VPGTSGKVAPIKRNPDMLSSRKGDDDAGDPGGVQSLHLYKKHQNILMS
jgi:hypothetical protein